MQRLPQGYSIARADREEIDTLIDIDLAAGHLFNDTGLIAEDALSDHVPADVFDTAIEKNHVLTARTEKGVAIGFALTSERTGTLYLDQISVHPDHGRQGLGSALITRVVEEAKIRKFKTVTLSTFRDLAWNGPFYKKLGFREVARRQMEDWMIDLEKVQAMSLDISQRCFMRRKVKRL